MTKVKKVKKQIKKAIKKIARKRTNRKKSVGGPIKGIKGRGDYTLGEKIGRKIGGWLGGKAHSIISKITGLGDYRMHGKGYSANGGPPQFMGTGRTTTVVHREYICDIFTGGTLGLNGTEFDVNYFKINPGDRDTFPWLSLLAQNYEEYRLRGCVFEFKSTSAAALNSTNTALGTVIMATQYDSLDEPFNDKRGMENHEFASSTMPFESVLHAVECKPSLTSISNTLYVKNGPLPPDADIRLYDLGKFAIATVGMQATNTCIGELWISFEVEFLKPKLSDNFTTAFAHYTSDPVSGPYNSNNSFGVYNNTTPAGNKMIPTLGSDTTLIKFKPELITGNWFWNKIEFQRFGYYLVNIFSQQSTNPTSVPLISSANNVEIVECLLNVDAYQVANFKGSSPYNTSTMVIVRALVDGASFLYTSSQVLVASTYTDVLVIGLPDYFIPALSEMDKLKKQISDLSKRINWDTESVTPLEEEKFHAEDLSESTVLARAISKLGIAGR